MRTEFPHFSGSISLIGRQVPIPGDKVFLPTGKARFFRGALVTHQGGTDLHDYETLQTLFEPSQASVIPPGWDRWQY